MNDYLTVDMLNDIENKVLNLHKLFIERFGDLETKLRNVEVGDNLNSKTLFLSFPWESYKSITNNELKKIITLDSGNDIQYLNKTTNLRYWIAYYYKKEKTNCILYSKYDNKINNDFNYIRYRLPRDIGKVISVDETDIFYSCIRIRDNETKKLKYIPKKWVINEIPYLQYIDNIEEGINEIAELFYKPAGYQYKEWTTTGYYNIKESDYGLAQKPISSRDFDRWERNIKLLEEAFASFYNVWNVVSYIDWNEDSQFEWEDY